MRKKCRRLSEILAKALGKSSSRKGTYPEEWPTILKRLQELSEVPRKSSVQAHSTESEQESRAKAG